MARRNPPSEVEQLISLHAAEAARLAEAAGTALQWPASPR